MVMANKNVEVLHERTITKNSHVYSIKKQATESKGEESNNYFNHTCEKTEHKIQKSHKRELTPKV